jgi:glycosyltransferase involved in cell wall biosynthesis
MVDITILLPVYNGASYLDDALNALSQQSFDRFEVLCIDDCSNDNSADILRSHAAKDPRFKYLHTGTNLGSAGRAANFAAPHARGLRFVYSSQDDLFSSDWLEKLHTRAQETGADAVLPDLEFYYEGRSARRRIIGFRGDHDARLTGQQAFAASLDWTISGNALYGRFAVKGRHGAVKRINLYTLGVVGLGERHRNRAAHWPLLYNPKTIDNVEKP